MKRLIDRQLAILILVLWSACTTALPTNSLPPAHPITTDPLLQIESGAHTGFINSSSVDAAGQLLLTASDDKTARLWSISDGRLLTVLRPPIDSGQEGSLYVAALSPDGRMAAVGGWTGASWEGSFSIYLFDTQVGRMIGRLSTGKYASAELAFSPDGRFLVAGFPAEGIRVWRTDNWSIALEDTKYLVISS
jgi:WD40 repeat protein